MSLSAEMPPVIFEDNHLLVVNKPAGMLVQGDYTGDEPLAEIGKRWLKEKYNKPGNVFLGVAHRIDRPVSGVVVMAKTSKALERLNESFREKRVEKVYWAVVKNAPPDQSGTVIHYLQKNQQTNTSKAFAKARSDAKLSELSYKVIGRSKEYYLLEVRPVTGRHHQIRVQLSSIGCTIKGDVKYGFARANDDRSIHLHARSITLPHPVSKEAVSFTADPPLHDNLWKTFL
jgi:23S rRNA pseudouridine1911/1915/1917 synthase